MTTLKNEIMAYFFDSEPKFISKLNKYVRKSQPDQAFWALWKEYKDEIKDMSISVSKWDGEWQINLWSEDENPQDILEAMNETIISEPQEEQGYDVVDTLREMNEEKQTDNMNEIPLSEEQTIDPIKKEIEGKLLAYQIPHANMVKNILSKYEVVADSSDTGTGKTYSTCAVLADMDVNFVIVCPKPVIPGWKKAIKHFGIPEEKVLMVVNYGLLKNGKYYTQRMSKVRRRNEFNELEHYCITESADCPYFSSEPNPEKYQKFQPKKIMEWNLPENTVIVWDEAHRCKNRGTQNTQMMITAAEQQIPMILLSATLGENPLKMCGTARALGCYNEPWEYYTWASKYGCNKVTVNRAGQTAWVFNGSKKAIMELRESIKDKMDGMDVDKLREMELFPTTKFVSDPIMFNGATKKIRKQYHEMYEKLTEIEDKLEFFESAGAHLQKIQKQMQQVELLKIPTLIKMIEDAIENNHSVAVFFNFTDSIIELQRGLKKKGIESVSIRGANDAKRNEENRLLFQNNKKHVIVCNTAAAREGIDLHDEHHKRKRISYISPTFDAQSLKQVLGRIDRAGGTPTIQYLLIADETIETEVFVKVNEKINNIQIINGREGDIFE